MIGRIAKLLKRLRGDQRGNVLILAGASLTAVVAAAGIGVDTVQWYLWKRQMQQAVDTGATAGAIAMTFDRDKELAVNQEVTRTANTAFTIEAINTPPATGAFAGDAGAIEVIAKTSQKLPFSSVFLETAPDIRVRAVATAIAVGAPCVIATATSGTGIEVFGGANVSLDCPVASNSPGGVSVDVGGSSYLDSNLVLSVGGIDYGSDNLPSDTAVVPYGLPVEDPLADRDLDFDASTCNFNNFQVLPNQDIELFGGTYCNGLKIQGKARLHKGTYIIRGGSFTVNSGANVQLYGDGGVTFILTGLTPTTVATISINAAATFKVAAPTSSENAQWAGILFYQDPIGPATHTINGGADIDIEGIIYMPTGDLTYNGSATQNAQCLLIVTERIRFGGTNNIENNCNADVDAWVGTARVIRVVE
ncbi:pilus assembly protein TadG-related protein [Erythrobacter mangrovi]|uniref:Uncharacterized protein n=1 Tax=Erythrobacter mangrovi TaxID=2739433 RepID=A0A7D3XJF1_9SPHN|nr:pilus assembly protein TadG-related protein [Erythrobacter mangrovi]QKG71959.1 hypothetical protein HQR01_11620 [Erythrobacter mangrovi]